MKYLIPLILLTIITINSYGQDSPPSGNTLLRPNTPFVSTTVSNTYWQRLGQTQVASTICPKVIGDTVVIGRNTNNHIAILQVAGKMTLDIISNGTGSDSLLVWNSTTKEIKKVGGTSSSSILPLNNTFTGTNTFTKTITETATGAGDQTGIYINSGVSSGTSNFSSGINIDETHSGTSGTVNSLYGVRINMHNTGTDTTIDLIGTKYNIPEITNAGTVTNYSHIFLTSPVGSGATTNTCINILGLGYGLSWSFFGNAPEQGFQQIGYKRLELITNSFAINNAPATFQGVSFGGDIFSTSLGIGVYTNHRIVATQNSASLYQLYLADTYSDSSFSSITHYGIDQEGSGINNFNGAIHSNSTSLAIFNSSLLLGSGYLQFSGLNISGQSMNFLENTHQAYVAWNYSGGNGETDLFVNRGGGSTGGYTIFDVSNSGVVTSLVGFTTSGMSISNISTATESISGTLSLTGLGNGVAHMVGTNVTSSPVSLTADISGILPSGNVDTSTANIGIATQGYVTRSIATAATTALFVNNATNSTLTRSGSGPYTLGINLANTNTWSVAQTFTATPVISATSGQANISFMTTSRNTTIGLDNSSGKVTIGDASDAIGIDFGGGAGLGTWNSTQLLVKANLAFNSVANTLDYKTGSNPTIGTATLSSGTVTVLNTSIKTGDFVFLTGIDAAGVSTDGSLSLGTIVNATSFIINSSLLTDTRVIQYHIIHTH